MPTVTIGGKPYEIEALGFKALKQAWPHIKKNQDAGKPGADGVVPEVDPIEQMSNAIAIVSAALVKKYPEMTPENIEEEISAVECAALDRAIIDVMVAAGFAQRGPTPSGEAVPAEAEAASLSTATPTE
jgi:hypothetical protein